MKPRAPEPVVDARSFLVVMEHGDHRGCGWGVDITQVETVLEPVLDPVLLDAELDRVFEAEALGFPGDAEAPLRVVKLRTARQVGGVAVRGRLTVVTVARSDVHRLPRLVATTMTSRAFSSVALADDQPAFLILDVEAALRETT